MTQAVINSVVGNLDPRSIKYATNKQDFILCIILVIYNNTHQLGNIQHIQYHIDHPAKISSALDFWEAGR